VKPGVFSLESEDFKPISRGKVREMYDAGEHLLMVASDRISAFDVVMGSTIPAKGPLLNRMSGFWFRKLSDICPNHLVSDDNDLIASIVGNVPNLKNRATLVRKCQPLAIECVVRGYIAGSMWKDYESGERTFLGHALEDGLTQASKLPEPIFTPATKATSGHDENIDFETASNIVGAEFAQQVRDWSIELYMRAADHADSVGIILADTKFEFGLCDDGLFLIDEAITPDSSRFWNKEMYQPGASPASYDKQFLRDYLETLDWNKKAPGPILPENIIEATKAKYFDAFRLITGHDLDL